MPSAGMQYTQRRLQRSVTEMRRSRTTRPWVSTRDPTGIGRFLQARGPRIRRSAARDNRGRMAAMAQERARMAGRQARVGVAAAWLAAAVLGAAATACAQQVADSTFDASVAKPAYTATHPRVLFDEAHRNFHTTTGRYKPFATLIANDGYRVTPNLKPFSRETLAGYDVLVIANAAGEGWDSDSAIVKPAFMSDECDAVRDWVRAGGALLLIADHAPFGTSAENLAQRFGVSMSTGYTIDSTHADPESNSPSVLVYSRANGLLRDHPITRGRDSTERIGRV